MATPWALGIDVGTTWTAAASCRNGRTEIIPLGDNQTPSVPTVVHRAAGEDPLVGEAAARRAATEPQRVAREFKRRLGDSVPLSIDGSPVSAEHLYADVLRWVVERTTAAEGSPPERVAVAHPANWGPYKLELLKNASQIADLSDVVFVSEPEAAAVHYAADGRVGPGGVVAVYDLGGGTFDACVLEATDAGFSVRGRPEGIERLGGIDFDEAVFEHVRSQLGDELNALDPTDEVAVNAMSGLRRECTLAKETLSSDTSTAIPVLLPGGHHQVRMTREELEARLAEPLQLSVDSLTRAIRNAGLTPAEVGSVLLVGGSSRIPLVGRLVTSALGRPVAVDANPKFSIALGAARVAERGPAATDSPVVPVLATGAPTALAASASATDPAATSTDDPVPTPAGTARSKTPILVGLGVVIALVVAALLFAGGGDPDDEVAAGTTSTTGEQTTTSADDGGAPAALTGEEIQVNDNVGFAGYVFDFDKMVVTPPVDEFSEATVTVFARVENRGFFAAQITAMDLEIDGIAHAANNEFFFADPGTTTELELLFDFGPDELDALESLDTAVLTIGEPSQNQAVVPLGPGADFGSAVRHPFRIQSASVTATYGPNDRYGNGTLEVTEVQIGASAPIDTIAEAGTVWFGIAYDACVDELDGFLRLRLVLPDGEKVVATSVYFPPGGQAARGEPLATACPERNEVIAYFPVDPALGGTEVTVEIDDGLTTESVVGTFTIEILEPIDELEFA